MVPGEYHWLQATDEETGPTDWTSEFTLKLILLTITLNMETKYA
jgi:hypothetical protein